MSNFGLPSETLKEARSRLPPIKLISFIDPSEPWVLVPDGDLLGFFHWVPKNLRVGPWSKFAIPTLGLAASILFYHRPTGEYPDVHISSYPELFSNPWWYNVIGFMFMLGVVAYIATYRSKGSIVTYTLVSWGTNMIRHGINTLAPLLHDNHALLRLNHTLRFPALVSASITCAIWNFVLLPFVYIYGFDSKEKRAKFVLFNCSPRMVQQHICNIFYAVLNTIVTVKAKDASGGPILFQQDDLWRGSMFIFVYGIFYLVILDRIGVHIYPVFSPRSNYVIVTWCTVFSLTYGFYRFWNWMMVHHWDRLRLDHLLGTNIGIILVMLAFHKHLS